MKNSRIWNALLIAMICALSSSVSAQWAAGRGSERNERSGERPNERNSESNNTTTETQIQRALQERFGPRAQIEQVRKTAYFGLYEFRIGSQLGYTDEKLSYIMIGDVLDGKSLKNLSEARLNELNRIPFDKLPLQLALKTVRGNGKRKLAIFEDPNCGYCKLFQKEIRALDNITIYSFVYAILGADSVNKSRQILCSANPTNSWQDWMLYGRMPTDNKGDCKNALEQIAKFGEQHYISSTPTLFFANGERVTGMMEVERLEQVFRALEK